VEQAWAPLKPLKKMSKQEKEEMEIERIASRILSLKTPLPATLRNASVQEIQTYLQKQALVMV